MSNEHSTPRFYLIQKGNEENAVGAALTDDEYAAIDIIIDDFNELHAESENDWLYITETPKDMLTRVKPHDENLMKKTILYHGIIYYWRNEVYYWMYMMRRSFRISEE